MERIKYFKYSPGFIFITKFKNGVFTEVNDSYCELTGFSRAELVGNSSIELGILTSETRRKFINELKEKGRIKQQEMKIHTKNGKFKDVLVSAEIIESSRENFILASGLDFTERKKLEDELTTSNENLTKTNELHKNLLYIIAHDLKGPLGNMHLILNIIKKQNPECEKGRNLFYIGEMLNRQENVINDLTELLEAQSDEELASCEIDMEDLINEIKTENEIKLKECGGVIQIDVNETPKIVYIKGFINSIIKNLITNAIKYRKISRKLVVNITGTRKNDYFLIAVKDNGIGLDLESYGKELFMPFKRFSNQASGMGVGLYIIKSLIEKNNGYIKVESKPGEGTTFFCYLKEY